MHLLVLGAFWPLLLGVASLRHFPGLERHRLRKHPAGPGGTAPLLPLFGALTPKGRRSRLWLRAHPGVVEAEPVPGLGVRSVSSAEPPGRPTR